MTRPHSAQPRRYHVRIFAPDGEIHPKRRYVLVLDLSPGPALARSAAMLTTFLTTHALGDDPQADAGTYRLLVVDIDTGETFDWTAT